MANTLPKMERGKVYWAPSYENNNINNNPQNLELFTEPVENVNNLEVKKTTYCPRRDAHLTYAMSSKKRGILFFVNIAHFPDPSKFRQGAAIDAANIITLFNQFEFNIFYYKNISLQTFHELIDQLIISSHLRSAECLVLCVSSHGWFQDSQKVVEFSCGYSGTISDITQKFDNINCPNLCGRPKILIFPMPRGSDEGVVIQSYRNRNHSAFHRVQNAPPMGTCTDMKICYANPYSDGRYGTLYIATFVNVLARYGATLHFDDMLKLINQEMSTYAGRLSDEGVSPLQLANYEDIGFNKKLFFNPGYYESN